jgi:putative flavoprotein involved in K+ transport
MKRSVDVAIIGGGQAGLATSWFLTQSGVDHVVLEAGGVADTWRKRRWDSFCLVTPNWTVQLPGAKYERPDPDGFMPLADLIDYFQAWANSFDAPVEENSPVSSLEAAAGGFLVTMPSGKLKARQVVVATGAYQRPHRPAGAETLSDGVTQLFAEEYHNPERCLRVRSSSSAAARPAASSPRNFTNRVARCSLRAAGAYGCRACSRVGTSCGG